MTGLASIPGVAETVHVRGAAAPPGAPPDLLLEVPHGATRAAHFDALRRELRGTFPPGLEDFFFVNTDVGAPEVALRAAERVVAGDPRLSAVVVRSLIPRTFIDCNRVIDASTRPAASAAGEVTPGIAEYVRDPDDLRLLRTRHAAYCALAERAFDTVCGRGGTALLVHSYAPRSLDVPVDERIVERLRREYLPENIGRWPLRAEVDLITRDPSGRRVTADGFVAAVQSALARAGIGHAEGAAYALHPSTLAHGFAVRFPDRTLCVEVRRDLLVRAFTPFDEMEVVPEKADRVAAAFADAVLAWRAVG